MVLQPFFLGRDEYVLGYVFCFGLLYHSDATYDVLMTTRGYIHGLTIVMKHGHHPPGGTQLIHKWKNLLGQHTVTTHAVIDTDGWPVHWDEKDLVIGNTKYIHRKELDP